MEHTLLSRITIDPVTECWLWTGAKTFDGYGMVTINGRSSPVHRIMYQLFSGRIRKPLTIDHLCRNRSCVNPFHMEAVTMKENINRGTKGIKDFCKYGHDLNNNANVYRWRDRRFCRSCRSRTSREHNHKKSYF